MRAPTRQRMSRSWLAALTAASSLLFLSCPSGLEGLDPGDTQGLPPLPESTNLRFGFDPCVVLTDPVTDFQVTGGVIPTPDGPRELPIAFVAFVTESVVDDQDDPVTDSNGLADVFVSAVSSSDIDPAAFTYAIAGKMRHTRCVTCHQMNVDVEADPDALPPTPFLTQDHFEDGGGKPPLNKFNDETCKGCHFPDWFSPGPTFDLRDASTENLFVRAQVPPGGLEVHFSTDVRVLWALDVGQTPFGGAADDDHDGIDEPEDTDGVRRHAPGGKKAFLEQLDAWLKTRDPQTNELKFSSAEDALHDSVLVSRADPMLGTLAGNGASSSPSLVFVPNPLFDPQDPTLEPAGTVHVAYQSSSTNMVGGANGFTNVFRSAVVVHVDDEWKVDLAYDTSSQVHVSAKAGGGDADGDSTDPDIAWDPNVMGDGARIAYCSQATDLVFGFNGSTVTCRPDVYLYDAGAGTTSLVSHVPGDPLTPGDGGSANPDLSPDGQAVAFESDATDLVVDDMNGTRDVFYALLPMLDVERASVMAGGAELPGNSHQGTVFHEMGAVKVAFASQEEALTPLPEVPCPQVLTLNAPAKDTTIFEESNNSGGGQHMFAGRNGNGDERRALVEFDLSGIPAMSTITAVSLTISVDRSAPSASMLSVHPLTRAWGEGTACGNGTACPGIGGTLGGCGAAPGAGDATWNFSSFNGTAWTTPGGDFGPSSGTESIASTGDVTWSTDELIADVQNWVNGAPNFGWLVRDSMGSSGAAKRIDSREREVDSDCVTFDAMAVAPRLVIEYIPPARLAGGGGNGPSDVYLRDSGLDLTWNLNRIVGPDGEVPAEELDVDGTALPARATNPVISPYGNAVIFESMAQNLDFTRDLDDNREMDVVLVDLLQLESQGFILPYKLSVTSDGGDANGPSFWPRIGPFSPPTDAFPLGLAIYATRATNLGNTDPGDVDQSGMIEPDEHNLMLAYLNEGASVVANFEADPERQGMNRQVAFESLSSGNPTTFTWDFGDGSPVSTERSPTHVYDTPGFYTVSLTVDGPLGTDDRTRTDYVHVLGPVMASFTTTKDASMAPPQVPAGNVPHTDPVIGAIDDPDPGSRLLFDLDSQGTEFPDTFSWTLTPVDGAGTPVGPPTTVSTVADPEGVEIADVGLYDLQLEATGPGGLGLAAQRLEVYQKVDASFTTNPPGLPVRGAADLVVQFTDTTTGDLLDQGAHSWEFRDDLGNVIGASTDANPMETFTEGVYFAQLTVWGKGTDQSESASIPIIADGEITAAFTVTPNPAGSVGGLLAAETIATAAGATVDFTNESQNQAGDPLFYLWDFGTGAPNGQEMVENPAGVLYTLASPENVQDFTVRLVTSKNNPAPPTCFLQPPGTCDEVVGLLRVFPEPEVAFMANEKLVQPANRPPHTWEFQAIVTGDGIGTDAVCTWLRSEADMPGATIPFASGIAPEFEFPDPGLFKVALRVETNGPGGTRQAVTSDEQDVLVRASTFTEFYEQAIAPASGSLCTNCHRGANPPAGLDWEVDEGQGETISDVYRRIVEDMNGMPIFSTNCDPSRRRIAPGDPEASVVFNVLRRPPRPLCEINMRVNLNGDETARDGHVAVLRSWILDDAPDN